MTTLLDEIRRAQTDAVTRVINGGMREDLTMAQVRAGEDVVVASLNRLRTQHGWDKPAAEGEPSEPADPAPPNDASS